MILFIIPWKVNWKESSPLRDLTWFVTTTGIRENSARDLKIPKEVKSTENIFCKRKKRLNKVNQRVEEYNLTL